MKNIELEFDAESLDEIPRRLFNYLELYFENKYKEFDGDINKIIKHKVKIKRKKLYDILELKEVPNTCIKGIYLHDEIIDRVLWSIGTIFPKYSYRTDEHIIRGRTKLYQELIVSAKHYPWDDKPKFQYCEFNIVEMYAYKKLLKL